MCFARQIVGFQRGFSLKTPVEATALQLVTQILVKKTRSESKGKSQQEAYVLKAW